jgi:peptidoglycan-associated lipoprotein
MKLMKMTNWLAFGLVLALAASGCRKNPGYLTKLPGHGSGGSKTPRDDTSGRMATDDTSRPNPSDLTSSGIKAADWDPANMTEDRGALAGETVHFDFDSTVVKAGEKSKVDAVAAALKSDAAAKLMIEGHCDERGTEEYNRSLGERRAMALRESLAAVGVDPMRVRTISFGEDKPVDPGHDESAYSKNRRGEFVLMHPK